MGRFNPAHSFKPYQLPKPPAGKQDPTTNWWMNLMLGCLVLGVANFTSAFISAPDFKRRIVLIACFLIYSVLFSRFFFGNLNFIRSELAYLNHLHASAGQQRDWARYVFWRKASLQFVLMGTGVSFAVLGCSWSNIGLFWVVCCLFLTWAVVSLGWLLALVKSEHLCQWLSRGTSRSKARKPAHLEPPTHFKTLTYWFCNNLGALFAMACLLLPNLWGLACDELTTFQAVSVLGLNSFLDYKNTL
ncbi:MAG: hypothetical protein V1797_01570 [Pseudomonadota bacterium]